MNVLLGKIESGFEVGQEVEQVVSQLVQRLGETPPASWARVLPQLITAAGFNDTQAKTASAPCQVELAGQKSAPSVN